jgi:hypothetical protein
VSDILTQEIVADFALANLTLGIWRRKVMIREQHTPQQMQDASKVLFYEVTMLQDLSCRMESLIKENTIIGTALLETFSIHTRVLHDFFYSENPGPDDVIADDFFDTSQNWSTIRNPKSELLSMATLRMGKDIGRLTYGRREVIPILRGWDYCTIANELQATFRKFIQAVPAKMLGPHCGEFKNRYLNEE